MNRTTGFIDMPGDEHSKVAKSRISGFEEITPAILTALREGDPRAFDKVYLRCFEPIEAFFRMLLRNPSEAEELCQDTFVKLWENRRKINPELNFRSFLYTVAKSAALNHLEHKNVVNKYVNYRMKADPDLEHSPDQDLISTETALILDITIARMPQQRRTVFEMSRFKGMSNSEIAAELNITPATVRAHLHNATKEIRELMALLAVLFFSLK